MLGLHNFVRGFRRAYKWRKQAIAVLIKIRFAFTGLELGFKTSKQLEFRGGGLIIRARGGLYPGGGAYHLMYFFVYRYMGL